MDKTESLTPLNIKTMKTTIFTIVFVAVIMCTGCTAQANSSTVTNEPMNDSIETLIKEFRKEKNVTYVNLPKSLIQIGMQMADDEDADKFLKQVDGIQILSFEGQQGAGRTPTPE